MPSSSSSQWVLGGGATKMTDGRKIPDSHVQEEWNPPDFPLPAKLCQFFGGNIRKQPGGFLWIWRPRVRHPSPPRTWCSLGGWGIGRQSGCEPFLASQITRITQLPGNMLN